MSTQQLSGIGDRVQDAVNWIHTHYRDFMALDGRITSDRARAVRVLLDAEDAEQLERAATARHAIAQLDSIYDAWSWAKQRVAWVASKIPGVGMGAWVVPLAVSAVALVAAAAAASVLYRLHQQERLIDLLEEGSISVADARALGVDVGASLVEITPGVGIALLAGAAGFIWWRQRGRR